MMNKLFQLRNVYIKKNESTPDRGTFAPRDFVLYSFLSRSGGGMHENLDRTGV